MGGVSPCGKKRESESAQIGAGSNAALTGASSTNPHRVTHHTALGISHHTVISLTCVQTSPLSSQQKATMLIGILHRRNNDRRLVKA